MTERGCAFAGAKGVITGAIKDVAHVVHSPIGCTMYGYGSKRYPTTTEMPDGSTFPIKDFNIIRFKNTKYQLRILYMTRLFTRISRINSLITLIE